MKKNVGSVDMFIRIILAAIIFGLFLSKVLTGILAIILLFVALFLVITSLINFCPVYKLLGWRSNSNKEKPK